MQDIVLANRPFALETQRLLLASLSGEDAGALQSLYGDWQVAQQLRRIPYPFSLSAADAFIEGARQDLAAGRGDTLGVFLRESMVFVGVIALHVPVLTSRSSPSRS